MFLPKLLGLFAMKMAFFGVSAHPIERWAADSDIQTRAPQTEALPVTIIDTDMGIDDLLLLSFNILEHIEERIILKISIHHSEEAYDALMVLLRDYGVETTVEVAVYRNKNYPLVEKHPNDLYKEGAGNFLEKLAERKLPEDRFDEKAVLHPRQLYKSALKKAEDGSVKVIMAGYSHGLHSFAYEADEDKGKEKNEETGVKKGINEDNQKLFEDKVEEVVWQAFGAGKAATKDNLMRSWNSIGAPGEKDYPEEGAEPTRMSIGLLEFFSKVKKVTASGLGWGVKIGGNSFWNGLLAKHPGEPVLLSAQLYTKGKEWNLMDFYLGLWSVYGPGVVPDSEAKDSKGNVVSSKGKIDMQLVDNANNDRIILGLNGKYQWGQTNGEKAEGEVRYLNQEVGNKEMFVDASHRVLSSVFERLAVYLVRGSDEPPPAAGKAPEGLSGRPKSTFSKCSRGILFRPDIETELPVKFGKEKGCA